MVYKLLKTISSHLNRIATDRHVSISSLMDKEHPGINYQYVCHLSKCVVKMYTNKAKQKGCKEMATIYGGVPQLVTLLRVGIVYHLFLIFVFHNQVTSADISRGECTLVSLVLILFVLTLSFYFFM